MKTEETEQTPSEERGSSCIDQARRIVLKLGQEILDTPNDDLRHSTVEAYQVAANTLIALCTAEFLAKPISNVPSDGPMIERKAPSGRIEPPPPVRGIAPDSGERRRV